MSLAVSHFSVVQITEQGGVVSKPVNGQVIVGILLHEAQFRLGQVLDQGLVRCEVTMHGSHIFIHFVTPWVASHSYLLYLTLIIDFDEIAEFVLRCVRFRNQEWPLGLHDIVHFGSQLSRLWST